MSKIVVTHNLNLSEEQKNRLKTLGEVTFYDNDPKTKEEWLERIVGFNIIASEEFGMVENLYDIKDVFISYPFVSFGAIDKDKLKANNVFLSNAAGCNKDAVCEWIVFMMLNLLRKFSQKNNDLEIDTTVKRLGLKNKKVIILGRGNIGTRVGEVCEALKMKVDYFLEGDDLISKCYDKNIIINCLSVTDGSKNLLNSDFFSSLTNKPFFITSARQETYDTSAMLTALSNEKLSGIADDCASAGINDIKNEYYQRLIQYENIIATPHIAWSADTSFETGNDIMIDNIEAWINNKPINLIN